MDTNSWTEMVASRFVGPSVEKAATPVGVLLGGAIGLGFLGAANVKSDCEEELGSWLKTFAFLVMIVPFVVQVFIFLFACKGIKFCLELGYKLQGITGIVMLAWMIKGWIEYVGTTDAACNGPNWASPRQTMLALLIIYTTLCSVVVCMMCCGILALLGVVATQMSEPSGESSRIEGSSVAV